MSRVDNLIEEIDKSNLISDIKEIQDKIFNDKELLSLLKEYENNPNNNVKDRIISNPLFCDYKEKEIDLNIFIMEINRRLKEISKKEGCRE